jgi:N,N'-diacetylchitobiose transport system substrate-binding protein
VSTPSRLRVIALAAITGLALVACSTSPPAAERRTLSVPETDGHGKRLTVWVMQDDYSPKTIKAINAEFTRRTGAKVTVQTQQWLGVTTKVTTALSTSTPPDVIDIGNTQAASFAAYGGLKDLTPYAQDLKQGRSWLEGLTGPATINGRVYAAPGFAGARAVLYNKKMWARAGVTQAPKTYAELTAALDKVRKANPARDFAPMYVPGQYWYVGMQFVWDAGGQVATANGAKWTSTMSSPKSVAGITAYQKFQNTYSTPASRTLDTKVPAHEQLFADGKTSAIVETNAAISQVLAANPKMKESDIGTFAFPGRSGAQPVMLGGSVWGIAAKSRNSDLALQWLKVATSPTVQDRWVFGQDSWIPGSIEGAKRARSKVSPTFQGFFTAALRSNATPASPGWAEIEGAAMINRMFASVASGRKSPAGAARDYDAAADPLLQVKD